MTLGRLVAAALAAVSVAACAGPGPSASATPLATATPSASVAASAATSPDASPIALGALTAGRYTHAEFTPSIVVEVPGDTWLTFHLSPDFFDVGIQTDEGPVAIMFMRPQTFVTPHGELRPATPEEAIQLLSHHEGVSVSDARSVEVDSIGGLQVDVTFEVDNTHVFRVTDGLIGFGPQTDVRLSYLEVSGSLLVIGLNVPAGTMEQSEELAKPVMESVQIGR